jgi:exodeoxyribonuclease VII large subunit
MSAPTTAESPWPVRTVARKIAEWVSRLGEVWVEGQIAQLTRRPGTKTAFLVLRDPAADVSLTVSIPIQLLDPALREGARVVVRAQPELYLTRGSLTLRASEIRHVGVGELLARLERLKRILATEGLFAPDRKKRLPFLPGCIGLITGRASAAERDVRENAIARWPAVQFAIENVAVQGVNAVPEIIDALHRLDHRAEVDVIVLARGGGSVEDLLPFSDEALCRAVADCRTPVVSAIGHEQDSPLLDLVADVRCSTPTDAGKRLVPAVSEEQARLAELRGRARRAVTVFVDSQTQLLKAVRARPVLAEPYQLIEQRGTDVAALLDRSRRCLTHRLDAASTDLGHTRSRVRALSPAATLQRGYAIAQTTDGTVLRAAADAPAGTALRIRLAEGVLAAESVEAAGE